MADDPDSQIVTPPEVALTPIDLPGQPATDKGFVTPSGTKIRARVVTIAVQDTRAPTNGDAPVVPSGMNLSLTLAVLNDDLTVAKDVNGALQITDLHEIIWHEPSMQNPNFDPQGDLERALRQEAYLLEQSMPNRVATTGYLTQAWGGAAITQPEKQALTPATSSQTVADILAATQGDGQQQSDPAPA